ncbi:serine/threonine/tyrosine-interacting protein [Plakobranchus ocellatus]|uniref:Serine/threonine/tyrosine-interacting protein n=1 Tax=Plakobranchus ocellatus TaxID=259542 RepID=A0AAV3ZX18_9GAST|nr:serine/threonine/tyrosine-interacting protein [Plakobranchus ocellatus]
MFEAIRIECKIYHSSAFIEDWEYAMRRDMQEIVPGVYLGPYASAMKTKLDNLLAHGITHIICIRQLIEASFLRPNFPQHFNYLVLDIADSPTENIIKYFKQTRDFIDQCLQGGGKILVHGNGGISRSAAVVVAYIMVKFSLTCRFNDYWKFCVKIQMKAI